ncbi:MAG: hypothetical protein JWR38_4275 [Mucilaginibacter sp.]|nr:hypothetical protein [Mucilaginibacter sp.]
MTGPIYKAIYDRNEIKTFKYPFNIINVFFEQLHNNRQNFQSRSCCGGNRRGNCDRPHYMDHFPVPW